jgi:acyl-CoA thioester hydrolase
MDPSGWPAEHEEIVRAAWIDDNDHMNLAYYVLAFSNALDRLRAVLGLSGAWRLTQMHTRYEREVKRGDPLRVTTQVLGVQPSRLHLFQAMFHARDGYRAATFESVAACNGDFPPAVRDRLAARVAPVMPEGAGRRIAMPVR